MIDLLDPYCTENALEVRFSSSIWTNNSAMSGAAIAVYKDLFSTNSYYCKNCIHFSNCNFTKNIPGFDFRDYYYQQQGGAVLSTLQVDIIFTEMVVFKDNQLTAICADNGWVKFHTNTKAVFEGNVGDKGGPIYLSGDASIKFDNHTDFRLIHNQALYGGAIYKCILYHYKPTIHPTHALCAL